MRASSGLCLLACCLLLSCPTTPAEPEPTPAPAPSDWTDHSGGLDDLQIDALPAISAFPEHPVPGGLVSVVAEHVDATAISVQPVGEACGTVPPATGPSPLAFDGLAGETGRCRLGATITLANGGTEYVEGGFAVRPALGGAPPLEVLGAGWLPQPLLDPDPTSNGPETLALLGPGSFANGQTVVWQIDWSGGEAPSAALLAVDGFEGHFRLVLDPAQAPTLTVRFAQDFFALLPDARDGTITLRVALIAGTARPRNVMSWAVAGEEVGSGEVQVGITWDTATDVDLHVIEPSGEEIYYSHSTSETGGTLDLDSNPGCSIDGINAENIFWPEGQAPAGDYTVRVNMYSDCDLGGASGNVTIHHCGEDSPESYPFSLGATGSQDFPFSNPGCGYSVAGRVTYEDRVPGRDGMVAGPDKPARFITVQVTRANGDVVGEASTDRDGRYLVRFLDPDDSTPTYRVRALATQDDAMVRQTVANWDASALWEYDEEIWAWETDQTFEAADDPHRTGVDMLVTRAQGAGALNIFDAGVTGAEYVRGHTGLSPATLIWLWQQGEGPKTAFSKAGWAIQVAGAAANPDEYDETTLLHEYGHMVMESFSHDDSPGGGHTVFDREIASKAWSEGWAHYFGCAAADTRWMTNALAEGYKWRLEIDSFPRRRSDGSGVGMVTGTEGNVLGGNMSEAVVAAILWDLHDATNETYDNVTSRDDAIWGVFVGPFGLGSALSGDRGQTGHDLIDFLDAWIRAGYGDVGAHAEDGMQGIVFTLHQMIGYDFTPPP